MLHSVFLQLLSKSLAESLANRQALIPPVLVAFVVSWGALQRFPQSRPKSLAKSQQTITNHSEITGNN